jgi:hypothetical protein
MEATVDPDKGRSRHQARARGSRITRLQLQAGAAGRALSAAGAALSPAPWRNPLAKILSGVASQLQRPAGASYPAVRGRVAGRTSGSSPVASSSSRRRLPVTRAGEAEVPRSAARVASVDAMDGGGRASVSMGAGVGVGASVDGGVSSAAGGEASLGPAMEASSSALSNYN